jgi:hypothetical protein
MEQLLRNLVWETVKQIALIGFLLVPMFVGAWCLGLVKKRHKQRAVAPFTGQPLRSPGESLRLKIEELDEKSTDEILMMVALPCFAAAIFATAFRDSSWQFIAVMFLITALYVNWRTKRLRVLMQTMWNYRIGFDGERVVGEELNQLMLDGYRVFHDLPFEGFNIDHVVVGASGVFALETKTKRKQTDTDGKKLEWRVKYDGKSLVFPLSGADSRWLDQAGRNAQILGDWLSKAVAEEISVSPILVLPGWLIDRRARGTVNVLNEKEVRYSFPRTKDPLAPALIQRIAHQLGEKCRLPSNE